MTKIQEKWKVENNKYQCPYCKKIYAKKGIGNHIWRKHNKIGKKFNGSEKAYKNGRISWQLNKTKETSEGLLKISQSLKKYYENHPGTFTGKTHTLEVKKILRDIAFKNRLGGHTSKQHIEYEDSFGKTVNLQSSYELSVAKELDKNDVKWIRPKSIIYTKNNIKHRYYPDFYLIDYNIYLDPKNYYLQKKDKIKINLVENQNNLKILILSENELSWSFIKNKIMAM